MSTQDYAKIEQAIRGILTSHEKLANRNPAPNKVVNMIAVDCTKLHRELDIKNIARRRMKPIIDDMLSITPIVKRFGMWVLAEVEGDLCVMVKLPDGKHLMQSVVSVDGEVLTELVQVRDALIDNVPSELTDAEEDEDDVSCMEVDVDQAVAAKRPIKVAKGRKPQKPRKSAIN